MRRPPYHLLGCKYLALAATIVALTVGVASAFFFLGWPSLPSSTSSGKADTATVVVTPSKPARLASPTGDVLLEFPAQSVDRQTTVFYRRVSPTTVTGLTSDFTVTDRVFDMSVADTKAQHGTEFRFLQPVTVTMFLTGEDASASGNSYSDLAIQRFDTDSGKWTPLLTTIDLTTQTAQVKIRAPDTLALTVRSPVSSPDHVLTHGPALPQGYLGRGVISLTIPKELGATNTARVSLLITMGGPFPEDRSTPLPGVSQTSIDRQPLAVADSLGVVMDSPVPVHQRMSFRLDAPGFEMTPSVSVPQQVRDGKAGWSWIIAPNEGPLGEREVSALVTANGQTLSILKTSVVVTRPEPGAAVTTAPGIHPHPTITSPPTPAPIATPVVKSTTITAPTVSLTPTPVTTPTAMVPPVPRVSPAPVSLPTAVPSITPEAIDVFATATPTPIVNPSPSPKFRLFINGVQAPALHDVMSIGSNTVILSKAAEADGSFQFNDKVSIAVSLEPGYRVEWRGVDAIHGPFATVYMNQDRFVAVDIVPPSVSPTPLPTPVPFYQPRPQARERPTVLPTPTPRPVRTYSLTVESVPAEGGDVSPDGVTRHVAGTRAILTATPADGYIFSHWSGLCSTSLDCMVNMDGDKTASAHFTRIFKLTTSPIPADGGSVAPSGTTLHRASSTVTVMASPAARRQFSQWAGDCSGGEACVVTMDSDKSVTAEFVQVFDLITEVVPQEGGSIFPEGKTSHREHQQVTVIASPADGYQFSEWGARAPATTPVQ